MRSKRWLLWSALLLVLALLGVLVFLASQYESAREQEALERDAGQLANELRNALVRDDAEAALTRAGMAEATEVFNVLIQRRLITVEEKDRV